MINKERIGNLLIIIAGIVIFISSFFKKMWAAEDTQLIMLVLGFIVMLLGYIMIEQEKK